MTPKEFYTIMNGEFTPAPPDEKYLVKFKDTQYYLNDKLAKSRKISDETLKQIVHWHKAKLAIFEQMRGTDDSDELKKCAKLVQECEYNLQQLWGFPLDSNYHHFWEVPGCKCPKIDNMERLGVPYKVIVSDCPIHGE
jgi:hypothetical protein